MKLFFGKATNFTSNTEAPPDPPQKNAQKRTARRFTQLNGDAKVTICCAINIFFFQTDLLEIEAAAIRQVTPELDIEQKHIVFVVQIYYFFTI